VPVRTHPVEVRDGMVYIGADEPAGQPAP